MIVLDTDFCEREFELERDTSGEILNTAQEI
jgi:hypothetical protein